MSASVHHEPHAIPVRHRPYIRLTRYLMLFHAVRLKATTGSAVNTGLRFAVVGEQSENIQRGWTACAVAFGSAFLASPH